ncbi:MAG: diacylglycerol kinase family protein [Chloroflexi bacterium]|nr:diacylglycerol kinase family protein [Chloroflexota bacterium]
MKVFIVLNPASGKNAREPILEAISRHFTGSQLDYEIYETVKGDKLGDIVRARLSDNFDLVVAAGGDGTVSAIIDGLAGSSVPLGIIPAGTGNMVARELNIPLEIEDAVALIAGAHKFRKIDAMRIGKRVYILNVSLGISASVISGTTHKNKNRFGLVAYVGAAILKIFTFRRRYLTVAVDGKTRAYRAVEVTISNCGILAKILYPKGPEILSWKTLLDYPLYMFEMITRRPTKRLSHSLNSEKSVSIRSKVPLLVQADGDMIGTTPVEVEVLAGALTVLVSETPVPVSDLDLDRNRVMSQYLSGFAKTGRRK